MPSDKTKLSFDDKVRRCSVHTSLLCSCAPSHSRQPTEKLFPFHNYLAAFHAYSKLLLLIKLVLLQRLTIS
jgi:hypothetical protein